MTTNTTPVAPTAENVLDYIVTHPTETIESWRMRYSGGVMTLFAVGPYQVRWDDMATPAFLKHWRARDHGAVRKHIVRWLFTRGNSLYVGHVSLR